MIKRTTEHRFHVDCDTCGNIASAESLVEAKLMATSAEEYDHRGCGRITICDTMAHYGKPIIYDAMGNILRGIR